MAEKQVRQLVKKLVEGDGKTLKQWRKAMRTSTNQYLQLIHIYPDELKELYKDNTLQAVYRYSSKEGKGLKESIEAAETNGTMDIFKQIGTQTAEEIYREFPTWWSGKYGKKKSGEVTKNSDHILVRGKFGQMEKAREWITEEGWRKVRSNPLMKQFESAFEEIVPEGDKGGKVGRTKAFQKFSRVTQWLHKGKTTVGTRRLIDIYHKLLRANTKKLLNSKETFILDTIEKRFGPILLAWSKNLKVAELKMEDTIQISGSIAPSTMNRRGEEDNDWVNLVPELAKILVKNAKGTKLASDFATKEGSKPFTQRAAERAASNIMDGIAKAARQGGAKVRVKKSFKEQKPKNLKNKKAGSIGKKQKIRKGKRYKGERLAIARRSVQKRKVTESNITLLALLNNKLPRVIMENMSSPSLENRTGRFAQSVKALRTNEKRGMENIIYTYDKDPYQVFEMSGRGDRRWATQARDPRTIIDESIREIAAKIMMGRFITTRI